MKQIFVMFALVLGTMSAFAQNGTDNVSEKTTVSR